MMLKGLVEEITVKKLEMREWQVQIILLGKNQEKMGQGVPCGCINTPPIKNHNIPQSPTIKRKNTQKTEFYSQRKRDEVVSPGITKSKIQDAENFPNLSFRFKKAKSIIQENRDSIKRQLEHRYSISHLETNDKIPSMQEVEERVKTTFESFTIDYILGVGGFGNVYLGYREGEETMYAIKQMKKDRIHEKNLIQNILLEKKILKDNKCNFISRSHHTFRDNEYYYIAMQWAQGGDVYSFIRPGTPRRQIFKNLGQQAIRFILGCVILGLEYLHEKNIVYSDMKPENLLVYEDGYVKLSDFGLSQELEKNSHYYTRMGTRMFFAPEMALRTECRRHVDLWALGVLAYELANFAFPFGSNAINDPKKFTNQVLEAQKVRTWDNQQISLELKSFINGLLKFEPMVRLGHKNWEQIKTHSFFSKVNFDWNSLAEKTMVSPLLPILEHKIQYKKVDPLKIRPFYSLEGEEREVTIEGWSSSCVSHNFH